jgi:peptidoglycan/LPS O-acetylase OafA/YrhL
VDIFFVLSGFLIGGLLMREVVQTSGIDVKRFLIRRGYKIWPSYLFYVVVGGLLITRRPLQSLIPNFFHLQNYLGTPLKQTWSLAVEEHFYILLAVTLAFMAARKALTYTNIVRLCCGVFVFSLAARIIGYFAGQDQTAIQWQTHTRVDTLMLGILLAAIYRFRPEAFKKIGEQKLLLVLGVAASVAFLSFVPREGVWMASIGYDVVAWGSACGLVLLFSAVPGVGFLGKARTTWLYHVVAKIGFYSYGIYLWHRVGARASDAVFHRLPPMNETVRWYLCTTVYFVIAIAIGALLTKLIELPFLHLRDREVPAQNASLAYGATVPTSD